MSAILTRADSRLSAAWVAGRLEGISADMDDGLSVALTPHTGEAGFVAGSMPASEILRRAVSALNDAVGRGLPSQRFDAEAETQRSEDFMLMTDLKKALQENSGLYMVYQPKICLHSGKPVGLEALIRWQHPSRGELSPGAFIPLAEQTDLLSVLTAWIIDQAVERLSRLRNNCIQLPLTINVSVRDFAREGFASALESKMARSKLPTSLLGIECLETERILESPTALRGLEMLRERGFTISLDDFGTGYSNISYLRRMPLDVIKLDRTLISELSSDTASRIIARSIIAMLKELDYTVVAEGVESPDAVTSLTEYGCDQAQGYFYSKPLREEALDHWLHWKLRGECH